MLFSIITVTYNASQWIERTFQSIADQTCSDFEIIHIDGASKDNTMARTKPFIGLISCQISEPDNGLYDAMNKGIAHAKGEYMLFLNAGDTLFSETTLEKLANEIRQANQPIVVYGETELADREGRSLGMRRLKAPERLTAQSFRNGMLVCHQSFLVRTDRAITFDLRYHYSADFDWCIRILKQGGSFVNSHLIVSRFLQGGTTEKQRKASLKERYNIMEEHYGAFSTLLFHLWFALRFSWAKLLKKEI